MNNQHPSQPKPHWLSGWLPSRGNIIFTLLAITLAFWAQSVGALPGASPSAAPQQASTDTIAYQGRLTNPDGNPLTGNYPMTFRLYDALTGGTLLWEEQWSAGVQVSDGLFNVMLGSQTAIAPSLFTDHDSLFLGIVVGGEEISQRVQLGSVPFAMQALTVPDGSVTTEKIVDGAVSDVWYLAPTSAVDIAANTDWTDIADTSLTFSLDSSANVFLTYSINVQPLGDPGGDHLGTRLVVDGAPYPSSGSHFHPWTSSHSNVNLNGNLVLDLAPGQHTVTLQWKSYGGTIGWNNNPAWGDGYIGARTVTAIAFYR